jgi:predicted DNA-binding transcriptional regulator AlpA
MEVPALLRADDAARFCSVDRATWRRWVAAGLAPSPIYISPRCPRWSTEVLLEWIRHGCPVRPLRVAKPYQSKHRKKGKPT